MSKYITDNIEVSYDDFDIEDFNEEISNEEDSDEENCNETCYLIAVLLFLSNCLIIL